MARRITCLVVAILVSGCATAMEEDDELGCDTVTCDLDCRMAGKARGECADGLCMCSGAVRDVDAGTDGPADDGRAEAADVTSPEVEADAGDSGSPDPEAVRDATDSADTGAALSCSEFMDCASACRDDACINGCFSRMCTTATSQLEAISVCVDSLCYDECYVTDDPAVCDGCVSDRCETEVSECLRSDC